MPGTILLDDLRDSVQNQLGDYVNGLTSTAQAAVAPVASVFSTPPAAPDAILQELQQHAQAALEASQQQAQPALQVLGGAQQAAGGAVAQLGQARDQVTQQLQQHVADVTGVGQQLQDHVNTVLGSTAPQAPAGVQSLVVPKPQAPTLGGPAPAAAGDVLGGPPSADTTVTQPPDRSMSLQDYARAAAQRAGIDPNIFVAQIQQESGFTPTAKSPAGAIGIAQFMPGTAQGMNLDPTDPYASLDAAAQLDAQNLKKYGGDYAKTLAAYNAGGGAVDQYGGVPPYKETQAYVSTILNNARQSGGPAVAPPQLTTAQARASDLGYSDRGRSTRTVARRVS